MSLCDFASVETRGLGRSPSLEGRSPPAKTNYYWSHIFQTVSFTSSDVYWIARPSCYTIHKNYPRQVLLISRIGQVTKSNDELKKKIEELQTEMKKFKAVFLKQENRIRSLEGRLTSMADQQPKEEVSLSARLTFDPLSSVASSSVSIERQSKMAGFGGVGGWPVNKGMRKEVYCLLRQVTQSRIRRRGHPFA